MIQDRNCLQHMIDMAEDYATSKASEIVDIQFNNRRVVISIDPR
jgi:hypothetical protein